MSQRHSSAVVLGAGMSGLLAARALSGHVARVTLVERDALPERDESRKGVPQSNDAHGLLASGYQAMELAAKQLPVLPGAGERQDVDAGDVRERAHLPAELYEDRSLWVPAERHARFEDDIQPWLGSRVPLVFEVGLRAKSLAKSPFVVAREEHHERLGLGEARGDDLGDVNRGLSGPADRLGPVDRLQTERPEKFEHRVAGSEARPWTTKTLRRFEMLPAAIAIR